MVVRLPFPVLVICLVFAVSSQALSSPAAWAQDDLVKQSDVIAIVDIHERVLPTFSGSVLGTDGKEFPTAMILYSSSVAETLYGRIAKEPLIIQFDGAGDRSPLEVGKYILFLKAEGHLFTPLESGFKITKDKVFWYKKPFFDGSEGPYFGDVPFNDAIRDIKQLIEKFKKTSEPIGLSR